MYRYNSGKGLLTQRQNVGSVSIPVRITTTVRGLFDNNNNTIDDGMSSSGGAKRTGMRVSFRYE